MTDARALKQHIQELHSQLEGLDEVDDETRALLETLRDDLERVAPEDGELSQRVDDAARQFAAEYPQLSRLFERVAETLSAMGI